MPHSNPARTSCASSLKRLSEEIEPFQMIVPSRRNRTLEPRVIVPEADEPLEGGDELLFVAVTEAEEDLRKLLLPAVAPTD